MRVTHGVRRQHRDYGRGTQYRQVCLDDLVDADHIGGQHLDPVLGIDLGERLQRCIPGADQEKVDLAEGVGRDPTNPGAGVGLADVGRYRCRRCGGGEDFGGQLTARHHDQTGAVGDRPDGESPADTGGPPTTTTRLPASDLAVTRLPRQST